MKERNSLIDKTETLKNSNRKASKAERINRFDRSQFNGTETIRGSTWGGNKGRICKAFPTTERSDEEERKLSLRVLEEEEDEK